MLSPLLLILFSSATEIADMMIGGEYAVELKILKISTGSVFEYVI